MKAEAARTLQRARELLQEHKLREAANLLGPWVAVNKQEAPAWELLAAVYFEAADWPAARQAAEQVVRLRPDSPAAHCNLGVILRKQQHYGEALRCQEKALELDPTHRHAHLERDKLEQALASADPATGLPPPPPEPPPLVEPETEVPVQPCRVCGRPVPTALVETTEGVCEQCLAGQPEPDPVETLARSWKWVWGAVAGLMLIVLSIGAGYLIAQRRLAQETPPPFVSHRPAPPVAAPPAAEPPDAATPAEVAPATAAPGAEPPAPEAAPTAQAPPDLAARDEALAALKLLEESEARADFADVFKTALHRYRQAAQTTPGGSEFWREASGAMAEYEAAQYVTAWRTSGAVAVDLQSSQGQWALARYPDLRQAAVPTLGSAGRTTYAVALTQIVHAAREAAAGHLKRARDLREKP